MVEGNDINEPVIDESDADSRVDMWSAVALVVLAWAIAIFWVAGQ